MIYRIDPITPQLLAEIWADLWDRGLEEFRRYGMTLDDAFASFLDYSRRATSGGVLLADGKPIMVGGICPEDGGAFTFQQATKDFDRHKLAIMRTMRRFTRAHHGDVFIYSTLVHPESEKFYRVLGFARDEWQGKTPLGVTIYRFKRR